MFVDYCLDFHQQEMQHAENYAIGCVNVKNALTYQTQRCNINADSNNSLNNIAGIEHEERNASAGCQHHERASEGVLNRGDGREIL